MKQVNAFKYKSFFWATIGVFILIIVVLLTNKDVGRDLETKAELPVKIIASEVTPSPKIVEIKTNQIEQKVGPCVKISVLMYHHIEEESEAKLKKQASLAVSPEFFRKHLQYLKDKGYQVIEPKDLIAFFGGSEKLSGKLAMITLDDAYADNYQNMYPILREFGFKATVFVPTGLLNNPDYLTWQNLDEMKGQVYFGNHTWSHHSSSGTKEIQENEISLADKQLAEHGCNASKVFAYPYGNPSKTAEEILKARGYGIAFTTRHGNMMCKGQAFELPRIRVGNAPLSAYGL